MDLIKDYIRTDTLITQCLATVEATAKHMKEKGSRVSLVKEPDGFVGIVTDEDITFKIVAEGRDPKTTLVPSIMTQPIITIDQDHSVSKARETMLKHKILNVVVTQKEGIIGLVYVGKGAESKSIPPFD